MSKLKTSLNNRLLPGRRQKLVAYASFCIGLSVTGLGFWLLYNLAATILQNGSGFDVFSAIFALPFFGLFLIGIGIINFLPQLRLRNETQAENKGFTGTILAGGLFLLLIMTGPFWTRLVMEKNGYYACATRLGTKMTITYWTLLDQRCADNHE